MSTTKRNLILPSRVFCFTIIIGDAQGLWLSSIIPFFSISAVCFSTSVATVAGIRYGRCFIGGCSPVLISCSIRSVNPTSSSESWNATDFDSISVFKRDFWSLVKFSPNWTLFNWSFELDCRFFASTEFASHEIVLISTDWLFCINEKSVPATPNLKSSVKITGLFVILITQT